MEVQQWREWSNSSSTGKKISQSIEARQRCVQRATRASMLLLRKSQAESVEHGEVRLRKIKQEADHGGKDLDLRPGEN